MPESAFATTSDGVRLSLRRFLPTGPRRGVVLLTHAMWANAGYLGRAAEVLAQEGVEAFTLDFRGHGRSVPPDPAKETWPFDAYVGRDLPAAVARVCELAGVLPAKLAYVGHSLGGLAVLAGLGAATVPPLSRLVLVTTSNWQRGVTLTPRRRAFIELFDASARLFGRAPIRLFRVGSDDENREYVAQLCRWARTGRWTSQRGQDFQANLGYVRAPALFVVADADPLCTRADAEALGRHLSGPVGYRQVGTAHGDVEESNHFGLFRTPAFAPLWREIAAYLTA